MSDSLTLLGATVRGAITADQLETIDVQPGLHSVAFSSSELCALCPVTGQPDLYAITVTYAPDRRSLESKSLKLYLHSFRNVGIFAESLAVTVCADLAAAVQPEWLRVELVQKARGGLELTARASHWREPTE